MSRIYVVFFNGMKKIISLAMLFALIACHHRVIIDETTGKLPYKVNGSSDHARIVRQAHFDKEGIQVITVGQDYLMTIPASFLFPNESPQLKWSAYAPLNAIACYLREFRKTAIHVTAFSNKCISAQRDRALTKARARAVGNYLWSQGISSQFIFTEGLGSDKPIVASGKSGDQSPNSRIEITFRDMVA